MRKKYTEKERYASNRYTSINSRVAYDLSQYWSRASFIKWYISEPQVCCYCGCTLEELFKFYDLTDSKRKKTRGRTLEIDRKDDSRYSEGNCVLSCYWCNNAKSDVFSYDEFHHIGKTIGHVIKDKIWGKDEQPDTRSAK